MTSQLFDTVIFAVIAFGFVLGMWRELPLLILGQYIAKTIIALLDTPMFYILTRQVKSGKH